MNLAFRELGEQGDHVDEPSGEIAIGEGSVEFAPPD